MSAGRLVVPLAWCFFFFLNNVVVVFFFKYIGLFVFLCLMGCGLLCRVFFFVLLLVIGGCDDF